MVVEDIEGVARLARELCVQAASTVAQLCDVPGARFWRSTAHRSATPHEMAGANTRFPTVSLCCAQALIALQLEHPEWLGDLDPAVVEVANAIPGQLEIADLSMSSLATEGVPSPFTVAQHIEALGLACRHSGQVTELESFMRTLPGGSIFRLDPEQAGPPAHPFVLYHLVMAFEETVAIIGEAGLPGETRLSDIYDLILAEGMRLLAHYHVGRASPAQIVALAFCGAGLSMHSGGAYDEYAIAGLRAACAGQENSGCWALGRLVREDKDTAPKGIDIEISTYEIAWALADAGARLITRNSGLRVNQFFEELLDAVMLAARYAEASLVVLSDVTPRPNAGWCSDHPYNRPMIESWTSATVLRAGLSLEKLQLAVESARVVRQYSVSRPGDSNWPRFLRWESFRRDSEVDSRAEILTYLDERVVQPIMRSAMGLPSPSDGTMSALLFGPPGTAKTTIARGLADGLGWPVVELNPGIFIERGLELIEAKAREVFDDLHRMERVVVLFDECDELFRARGPSDSSEQMRGITAFVTASMLPKLQRLHDQGRVVFLICTNNFKHLDPAVKRQGRIDHIIGVGPPDEVARRRLVLHELSDLDAQSIARLWTSTERFTRSELSHLLRQFGHRIADDPGDAEHLDTVAQELISQFAPSLNISRDTYIEFMEQQRASSHPHVYRRVRP